MINRFSLDNVFGIHEHAISLRARRATLLASNLANADTPNYKARDIDFHEAFADALGASSRVGLAMTDGRHIGSANHTSGYGASLKYRQPWQPAVDGNSVETAVEQAAFLDNAIRYQASVSFLNGRIQSVLTAIREE